MKILIEFFRCMQSSSYAERSFATQTTTKVYKLSSRRDRNPAVWHRIGRVQWFHAFAEPHHRVTSLDSNGVISVMLQHQSVKHLKRKIM